MRLKQFVVLCSLVLFAALTASADGGGPVYNVDGTITFQGKTGSETINFSFQAEYVYSTSTGSGDGWYLAILPGATATGSDPALGAIDMGGPGLIGSPRFIDPASSTGDANANLYGFSDAQDDFFDLYFQNNGYPTDPSAPALAGGYIWSCISSECDNNYCDQTSNFCLDNGSRWDGVNTYGTLTETTTAVATPEPRVIALLIVGLAFVLVTRLYSRRSLPIPLR